MPKRNSKTSVAGAQIKKASLGIRIKRDIKRNWMLYLILLPGLISLVLFKLGPMAGMVIAFEDFSAFKGIFESEWVGFQNFIEIFQDPYIPVVVKNTVIFSAIYYCCFSDSYYFCSVFKWNQN